MPKKLRKSEHCLNCGQNIGQANYCPHCGQLNTNKQVSLKIFLQDFLGDYFTFDSRLFRSFFPLIAKPGFLTREYNSGRRSNYILPLRLYIFTTFLFFLILTLSSKLNDWNSERLEDAPVALTKDSLRTVLKEMVPQLSPIDRQQLADRLHYNFDITPIPPANDKAVADSVQRLFSKTVKRKGLSIPNETGKMLVTNFKFTERDKRSKSKQLARLDSALKYAIPEEEQRQQVIETLDSGYYIKAARRKSQVGHVTIFGNQPDSTSGSVTHFLEAKLNRVVRSGDEGQHLFLSTLMSQIPKVVFLMLPLFALLLKLFYIRHRIVYINHLIFALHLHTIFFVYILLPVIWTNGWVLLVTMLALWLHFYLAFHNVYRQSYIKTFFKMNLIMFLYTFSLTGGALVLVLLTIVSI